MAPKYILRWLSLIFIFGILRIDSRVITGSKKLVSHTDHYDRVTSILNLDDHQFDRDDHISVAFFIEGGGEIIFDLERSKRNVLAPGVPVWMATSEYSYQLVDKAKNILKGDFYHDNEKKAIIFVQQDKKIKSITYEGVFGEGETRRRIHYTSDNNEFNFVNPNGGAHLIIDSPENNEDDKEFHELYGDQLMIVRDGIIINKLSKPLLEFYPKLLIVVDYHLFKLLGENIVETVKYVATFWNVADQKYAKLEKPKIQLAVSGIIIANDEKALSHVYQAHNGTGSVDIFDILNSTREYVSENLFYNLPAKNYDAVILMTGLKIQSLHGLFQPAGIAAKIGGICLKNNNVAIISDDATYGNTVVGVHELGHLLYLVHDFADQCYGESWFWNPNATSVMSNKSNSSNIFWSDCSKQYLEEFSWLQASRCLEKPYHDEELNN